MRTPYDLAVVGGGLAGLAAAGLVAAQGHRVLLLEARGTPGGRALGTSRDGFHVNLGPRALYRGGEARRVLRRLGVTVHGGPPPADRALALFEGRAHRGFLTVPGLLTTPLLGARDRAALGGLLATARPGRPSRYRDAGEWFARRLPSERARLAAAALARVATYLGDPTSASAEAVATQLGTARLGVRYVDGGWRTLAEALTRAATKSGVEIRCGARIGSVVSHGSGHDLGVHDGQTIGARTVIVAGLPPARTWRLLGVDPPAPVPEPLRAACLDVALRRLPDPRRPFVYGVDEPLYLVVHSAGAKLARTGGAVLHLVRYDDGTAGPDAARARLEALLDEYQPGWRDEVVLLRYLPRLTVAHTAGDPATGLAGRPDVTVRPGVYVAGDWVGPLGLLADAALASADRAATRVLSHLAGG